MSRSTDQRDDGFTLVEILVSLTIFLVVMAALLPLLIGGIRSTATARMVSQAKGVTQGQLDRMRNLPFHVARDAGEFLDVLDFHYRDLTPPGVTPTCTSNGTFAAPSTGWTGYVTGTTRRCSYEPQSGAMYRYVAPAANGFTVVVDTQFLTATSPATVVTPPAGYNTQTTGSDSPAAPQIGVTVTVLYADRGTLRPVTTYSQIADEPTVVNRIKLRATATAVEVGSTTTDDGAVSLAGGLLNLGGSLTYASTASANLVAASAGLATGEQGAGASASLAAPPIPVVGPRIGPAGGLVSSGCALVCWGANRLDLPSLSATSALPNVGSASAPMQSLVITSENHGLSFENSAPGDHRPELGLTGPLVRLDDAAPPTASGLTPTCRPGSSGVPSYVTSSGYAISTESGVEACAVSRTSTISLFPTSFAPRGVLQVDLTEASARCVVSGAGHTPTVSYDYRAVVRYHDGSAGPDAYVVAAEVTPGSTDPLAGIDLSAVAVGGGHVLGDYVASWSSFLQSDLETTSSHGVAAVRLPGVLNLTSQPVRTGTEKLLASDGSVVLDGVSLGSAVSVSVGAVGCSAEDAR